MDPRRIIRLRFVYRDKNASLRTPQMPLPIKAKARLCAQASREPLAMMGQLKLDSPTVQRVGINIFLQITTNLGWFKLLEYALFFIQHASATAKHKSQHAISNLLQCGQGNTKQDG